MALPTPVGEEPLRAPKGRAVNIAAGVTPPAVEDFDYLPGHSVVSGVRLRLLSLWGTPWWTADRMTGYGSGAYGAGPYGTAAHAGEYGALRYGRGQYGTGGYA